MRAKEQLEKFRTDMEVFRDQFRKEFGKDTLQKKMLSYEVISTGSVELDVKTGVGGYVEGRITEMWGNQDAGKTSMAILGCVEAQKKYPHRAVAYIDAENKMDQKWAVTLGIDLKRWELYVPASAEDVADAVKRFLDSPLFSFVVVDSIGALISRVEQEKNADESVVAIIARIVTRMTKQANLAVSKNGSVFLVINQPRDNIARYGSATTTPGGRHLKHASTMKFHLSGTEKNALTVTIDGEPMPVGREIAVKIERNKVAPYGRVARILFKNVPTQKYGPVGVDKVQEIAGIGKRIGVIVRSGRNWVIANSGTVIAGKWEDVEEALRNSASLLDELSNEVRLKSINALETPEDVPILVELSPDLDDPSEMLTDDPVSEIFLEDEDLDDSPAFLEQSVPDSPDSPVVLSEMEATDAASTVVENVSAVEPVRNFAFGGMG